MPESQNEQSNIPEQAIATPQAPIEFIGCHLDCCPPANAKSAEAVFYRIVKTGNMATGFTPRCNIPNSNFPDTCDENGVSLCPSPTAVASFKNEFPSQKRKPVAKVAIRAIAPHGVWFQDSDLHANWWHQIGFDPSSISEFVEGL